MGSPSPGGTEKNYKYLRMTCVSVEFLFVNSRIKISILPPHTTSRQTGNFNLDGGKNGTSRTVAAHILYIIAL